MTGELSWRRLRMLVRQLPRESRLLGLLHGADVMGWTAEMEMLAQLNDLLKIANWQRAGKKNAPKPRFLDRPGRDNGKVRHGRTTRPQGQVRALLDSYSAN